MALTVTTDLLDITTAEAYASPPWYAIGAQTPATEPDFFAQGSNCLSRAVSNTTKGMVVDYLSGIDFTAGTHKDKLVYIWMKSNTPGLCALRENGGLVVRLCTTSAEVAYREWYVDGKDTIVAIEGWTCYVIDPQSDGSYTSGAYSAASVRYFGGTMTTTTTAKGQNFGIDAIRFGRGELYVSGTVATAGAGFKEIAAVDFGIATNRWGIITEKQGIYYVRGKVILGHATLATTFSSQDEIVVWETPSYKQVTNVVQSIPDASVGGTTGADGLTTYNGLAIRGGSGATTIGMGVIVGSDNGRSGATLNVVSNPGLTVPKRTLTALAVSDSAISLSLYGTTFKGFEANIDLYGTNLSGDDCFGCTFNGCGRIRSNMEVRNIQVLNSIAGVTDGALLWESTTDVAKGLFVNNSRAIVFEAVTGTPFTFTDIIFSGNTYDVRNESLGAIAIGYSGGTEPTVENSGAGSETTVSVAVTLKMVVTNEAGGVIVGAYAYIDDNDQTPFILNTTTDVYGEVTTGYTGTAVPGSRWRVRKYGYKQFKQFVDIGSSDITLYVTLVVDPQQV